MSHIFPCNSDKNKATNKKYTSNERRFSINSMKRFQKLDGRGFIGSKIDIIQRGNFLHFLSTDLEKMENINFYLFLCNSSKN